MFFIVREPVGSWADALRGGILNELLKIFYNVRGRGFEAAIWMKNQAISMVKPLR